MRYMMFIKHTEDYQPGDVPASLYQPEIQNSAIKIPSRPARSGVGSARRSCAPTVISLWYSCPCGSEAEPHGALS